MMTNLSSSFSAPLVIAHRGGAHAAPENTLAAFRQGWADGADGAEGDFFLSKDGEVVCIHDRNTRKLADKELDVTKSTLAELKTLDVGIKKHKDFSGERVPTLQEVIATMPEGKMLFIEVKDSARIIPPIKKILDASQLAPSQVAIISFDKGVVQASKKAMPEVKAYWIFNQKTLTRERVEGVQKIAKAISADGIDTEAHNGIDESFCRAMRAASLELHCWTVNDVAKAERFAALGFDSITTDRPALVAGAIR